MLTIICHDFSVSFHSSPHLIIFVSFWWGLRNIYLVLSNIFGRSIALIFSDRYSRIFSVFSLRIPIVKDVISERETLSTALSKNRTVKPRNPMMTSPSIMTANVGFILSINPDRVSPKSDPMPYVILFRASIFPYSLGWACESIYPNVEISFISFVRP